MYGAGRSKLIAESLPTTTFELLAVVLHLRQHLGFLLRQLMLLHAHCNLKQMYICMY